MTRGEIVEAIRGAAMAALLIGLYWLALALADMGELF
jgi:hypothetical protein